jgi:DNA mismatch repair protein MutL
VNVHPQKVEVRFARPQEVYGAVRHAVAQAVARAPWLDESPGVSSAPLTMLASPLPPPTLRLSDMTASYADAQERALFFPRAGSPTIAPLAARSGASFFERLVYLGQLATTYLVCEADGELVLIDQHAAHERIAFQRLRDAFAENRTRTQRLLFPRTLELGAAEAAAAEAHAEALAGIGFELQHFGGAAWALTAAPADLRDDDVEPTLRELLGELAESELSRAVGERMDAVFATVACHSVVRAGDVLSNDEARALLGALDGIDFRAHCPHGRPVLLRISVAEIARRFGRT